MLTVRIVGRNGHEIVREAECVVLYPSYESNDGISHLMIYKSLHGGQGEIPLVTILENNHLFHYALTLVAFFNVS